MAVLNSSARSVPINGPPPRTCIRLGERSDPEQRGVPALIDQRTVHYSILVDHMTGDQLRIVVVPLRLTQEPSFPMTP